MDPGRLNRAVAFASPITVALDDGGIEDGWESEFSCQASFLYLRGGETVQAARLQGRQPAVLTIRKTSRSAAITTDWRVTADTGEVWNIRAIVPSDDRAWLELTCESGVAT